MTIGGLAGKAGIAASAIRYYEKEGLLKPPARVNGRRIYSSDALPQLIIIRFAKENAFTLPEVRLLLRGFPESTPASARWKKLARAKIRELESTIAKARAMKEMLESLATRCRCRKLDQCAQGFAKRLGLSSSPGTRAECC
ncbi:MAG TPA: MerR family transcriptional regulator [Candidatus Sulfotelmatobacter sp.]|nr:MerR family transcriptional regulator [Candidatus Sulfotelmatobacter sp.]